MEKQFNTNRHINVRKYLQILNIFDLMEDKSRHVGLDLKIWKKSVIPLQNVPLKDLRRTVPKKES